MPPRKRAAKKKAPVEQKPVEEEWKHRWPKAVVEKHRQRQEQAQKLAVVRIEQKQQRLINNGVPPEKRPI